jgi:hypothetical protein
VVSKPNKATKTHTEEEEEEEEEGRRGGGFCRLSRFVGPSGQALPFTTVHKIDC